MRRTNEQSLGTFKESNALSDIRGASDRKVIVLFVQTSEGELSGCKTCNFNVFTQKETAFHMGTQFCGGGKVKVIATDQKCK